jgi:hypothetical protein
MENTTDTPNELQQPAEIRGSYAGRTNAIKTFFCDTHLSETCSDSAEGGYLLTTHTVRRQLWSLQFPTGFIIGVGDPFSNEQYAEYLSSFPAEVIDMLKKQSERYKFSTSNALLFAVNNTMRLIPAKEGLFYLGFPDSSFEIISSLYDNPAFSDYVLRKHEHNMGGKIGKWLYGQFTFIEGVEKIWRNTRDYFIKILSND